MRVKEEQLDHAFAEMLQQDSAFRNWLLGGSRFSRFLDRARLLDEEQASARNAKHWWKHWWCRLPDGSESETDVFAVFEPDGGHRFAFHIENKPAHGKLLFEQAAAYRPRAIFMAGQPRFLDYRDFETIVMAPKRFLEMNAECCRQFDRQLSYEDICEHVPLFERALG